MLFFFYSNLQRNVKCWEVNARLRSTRSTVGSLDLASSIYYGFYALVESSWNLQAQKLLNGRRLNQMLQSNLSKHRSEEKLGRPSQE